MSRPDRIKLFFVCILIVANVFVWATVYAESPKDYVKVAFLDVGQGDAIFIEGPTGNQMLIDGGPNKSVLRGLGKMMPFYDRSIDVVLATHPDSDHITGLVDVVSKYKVGNFLRSGAVSDSAVFRELDNKLDKKEIEAELARAGMKIDLGGGAFAFVLFPDRDVSGLDSNDASVILKVVYGDSEVLLTGDSSKKIEDYVAGLYAESLESDILKAGHHGSKTSSSNYFLSAVDPGYFIVSAEEDSRYGHPHKEVIDLAKSLNLEILETSKEGNIIFELREGSVSLK